MHRLVLLRHAKAAREAGGGDRQRPLTRRGREDAARVGRYLVEEKLLTNLAVISDAQRTRETLDCVMGETGRNFGAGMSGGIAYVYDVKGNFANRCNRDMIDLDPLDQGDVAFLQDLITKHHAYTNSTVAKFILKDWENQLRHFVKVFPKEYKAALQSAQVKGQKVGH